MKKENDKITGKKILILAPTLSRAKEMAKERLGRNDVVKIVVENPTQKEEISPKDAEVETVPEGKSYLYIVPRNYI